MADNPVCSPVILSNNEIAFAAYLEALPTNRARLWLQGLARSGEPSGEPVMIVEQQRFEERPSLVRIDGGFSVFYEQDGSWFVRTVGIDRGVLAPELSVGAPHLAGGPAFFQTESAMAAVFTDENDPERPLVWVDLARDGTDVGASAVVVGDSSNASQPVGVHAMDGDYEVIWAHSDDTTAPVVRDVTWLALETGGVVRESVVVGRTEALGKVGFAYDGTNRAVAFWDAPSEGGSGITFRSLSATMTAPVSHAANGDDDEQPVLLAHPDGGFWLAWLQGSTEQSSAVRMARLQADGTLSGSPLEVAGMGTERSLLAGAILAGRPLLAWCQGRQIRIASVDSCL